MLLAPAKSLLWPNVPLTSVSPDMVSKTLSFADWRDLLDI